MRSDPKAIQGSWMSDPMFDGVALWQGGTDAAHCVQAERGGRTVKPFSLDVWRHSCASPWPEPLVEYQPPFDGGSDGRA